MKKKLSSYFLFIGIIASFFSFSSSGYANDNYGAIEFYEVSSTSEPVNSSTNAESSTEQSSQQTDSESSSSKAAAAITPKPSGMQPSLGELQKMGLTIGGFLVILLVLIGFWMRNKKRISHK